MRSGGGAMFPGTNPDLITEAVMTWTWQFEKADGTAAAVRGLPKETFPSQGDAESWIGENWRGLLDAGVDQVSLTEDGRVEYGPMSLHPEAE